jgi:hypothetical protein
MGSTFLADEHGAAEIAANELRTTVAIRDRASQLLRRTRAGESRWFIIDDGSMQAATETIVKAAHERHGRGRTAILGIWRHFEAGGIDRRADWDKRIGGLSNAARAHILIDLTIVTTLLGGDAGADWKYTEAASGKTFAGGEGLALAGWHAFLGGLFSSDPQRPLQVDSKGLRALPADHLKSAFQVTESNRLDGIEDRAILLRRLGEIMEEAPEVFGDEVVRPSGIFDEIISPLGPDTPPTADVAAHDILSQLLTSLQDIWPASNSLGNVPLGDCWRHSAVHGPGLTDGWMPFHTPAQWMTYSLLEPFEWCGVKVRDTHLLTALPDSRIRGPLLDSGLLRLRDEQAANSPWQAGDEIVVEWRALNIALMDEVAAAARMPLARIVVSGTRAPG